MKYHNCDEIFSIWWNTPPGSSSTCVWVQLTKQLHMSLAKLTQRPAAASIVSYHRYVEVQEIKRHNWPISSDWLCLHDDVAMKVEDMCGDDAVTMMMIWRCLDVKGDMLEDAMRDDDAMQCYEVCN